MDWIRTILQEIIGLFVDDGSFALAIVVWLMIAWLLPPRLGIVAAGQAVLLVGGLALILLESAMRRARR